MPTETISTEQELRTELATVQQTAIVVKDQQSYDLAVSTLTEIKQFRKKWNDYWTPLKDNAYKSWKGLCDKFNEGDKPAEKAENEIKRELLRWDQEQERIRQEAQRRAQEEAERIAQAARDAAAAEAEVMGLSDEEIEQAMESVPVVAVAPPVQETYQKASNISKRDCWKARVTDVKLLCKCIGAGKLKFSPEDQKKIAEFFEGLLRPMAVSQKSTMAVPGVEAYNEQTISGRTR